MAERLSSDIGIDQRLVRLAAEPFRIKVLKMLNERTAGVSEIAGELGTKVSDTRRHLEQMCDAGLLEVVGEVLGSGAIEPCYRAVVRVLWTEEEWAELSLAEQRQISAWIIREINADVCEALEVGTFDARPESYATRAVFAVDEEGWSELTRIHQEALDAILAVEAASAERLAESGEKGTRILSAGILSELPAIPRRQA